MGADNQQERLEPHWIVGFADGEGCFHVSINRMKKMSLGWQVLPEFRIVQHGKEEELLHKIKHYFQFGEIKINRTDKHGTRKELRVRGLDNLIKLINFFKQYPLQTTSKRKNFELFVSIIKMMEKKEHLTKDGIDKIARIVETMNRQPKIKYLESSETIRQTSQM